MIFLQPIALLAIPLIAIPLIIHWWNHRRHQPLAWGAMHFLKQAQKFNKGMAKIRYWILLAVRMAAIAAVLFVLSRPLRTGFMASWLGSTSTTVIVLDRSPSMQQVDTATGLSKREAAIRQLDAMFESMENNGPRFLVTSTTEPPLEIPRETKLQELLKSGQLDASSNVPSLVASMIDWAKSQISGPVDIWICSDAQANDWNSASGQWYDVREQLQSLPVYRLNVLNLGTTENFNAAIAVENVQRRESKERTELLFDLRVTQTSGPISTRPISLNFEISGVRTTVEVELNGQQLVQAGLSVPIDSQLESGHGSVTIPGDANLADNKFCFVFAKPIDLNAVIVADDPEVAELLQISWEASSSDHGKVRCQVIQPSEIATLDWQRTSAIAWQTTLPNADVAGKLKQVTDRGGIVLFFPPSQSTTTNDMASSSTDEIKLFGASWMDWKTLEEGQLSEWRVVDWRDDSDLLRKSATGIALPLGDIRIQAFRRLAQSGLIPLATLDGGQPLLARAITQQGSAYFCSTLPTAEHSSFVEDGVVLYVMMQRALESALASAGNARMLQAGVGSLDMSGWQRLDSQDPIIESERHLLAGAYEKSGMLMAINRPKEEDDNSFLTKVEIEQLLEGTESRVVESTVEPSQSLASELWRWFVAALVLSLLVEAWMTLPRKASAASMSLAKEARS